MRIFSIKILLLLTLLIITNLTFSQVNVSIINQNTIGGNLDDVLYCTKATNDGGYIIGGYSESGISVDKTDTSRGAGDFWILKLNSDLSINWQKTIGTAQNDYLNDILLTDDGGYLLAGSSNSVISGDRTVPGFGGLDCWILKLDSTGSILWQKSYGGSQNDGINCIIQLNNGNYLIAGSSFSDSSGVKSENGRGFEDIWIVYIDSVGNLIWDKTLGGNSDDQPTGLIQLNANEFLISSIIWSTSSGDITDTLYGMTDIWVVKMDLNKNVIWNKTYGGSDMEYGGKLIKENNSLFMIANSSSNISGVKSENSKGDYDYWILKLDLNGNIIWDKTIGGSAIDDAYSACISSDKLLVIGGSSNSGISGDKTQPNNGLGDYWVVAIDTLKNIIWQKTIGGNNADQLQQIIEPQKNTYLLAGYSKSGLSSIKTEPCYGVDDFWLVELSANVGIPQEDNPSQNFAFYPNPFANSLTLQLPENLINSEVQLYDIVGKQVMETLVTGTKTVLNTTELVKGIYIVKVVSGDSQVFVGKVVKE